MKMLLCLQDLPDSNISSVDLSNSQLSITRQITGESTDGNGVLTFDLPMYWYY